MELEVGVDAPLAQREGGPAHHVPLNVDGYPLRRYRVLTVLKCHFQPSTILNNQGKLHALLAYLYH